MVYGLVYKKFIDFYLKQMDHSILASSIKQNTIHFYIINQSFNSRETVWKCIHELVNFQFISWNVFGHEFLRIVLHFLQLFEKFELS